MYRYPTMISIESHYETILKKTKTQTIKTEENQTISLFSIGTEKCLISTKGLKWELKRALLSEKFMSISNVCLNGKFEIEVHEGTVLCSLVSSP